MANVCVLLADGFEEIEAITIIDVLRRARLQVAALGVTCVDVRGAHNICLHADGLLRDAAGSWDAVVVPGGARGAETLRDHPEAQAFLRTQAEQPNVVLAAICAGPIALAQAGVLRGKQVTCFPGFEQQLEGGQFVVAPVVQDGRVVTSRGVGTALAFALTLVARLSNRSTAEELRERMLVSASA